MIKPIKQDPTESILVTIALTESAQKILNLHAENDFVTEVAFFAERDRFEKLLDDGEWDGDYNRSSDQQILKEVKVKVAPIEIIRNNNNESEDQASTSEGIVDRDDVDASICRICHAGISMGELLQPCRCRGSIAMTHMNCLERWLKESGNSNCELCQHHFQIIRKPKYGIPMSVLVFLRHPGEHFKDLLLDLLAFAAYTPSAIISTYILMLICDKCTMMRQRTAISSHIVACCAILGMAAIDFTYSSWLTICFQRHQAAWREWYRNHCEIQIVLPPPADDKNQHDCEDTSEE